MNRVPLLLALLACNADTHLAAPTAVREDRVDGDILARLTRVSSSIEEMQSPETGIRWFKLTITQVLDPQNPEVGTFEQVITLRHLDETRPVVMYTSGYGLVARASPRAHELTRLLNANQVNVEHRFFGGSKPAPTPWSTMTIENAAADHHHIVELLKPIYQSTWLTTGTSKDGMTATYFRRFYPNDVDATVAYVAPLSYGLEDKRYTAFLEEVGNAACRGRIVAMQRAFLTQRAELTAVKEGATFTRVPYEMCFEHAVQEARYSFWQYGDPAECDALPGADATADALREAFATYADPVGLCSDQLLGYFDGYYYQAAAQLGSYGPLDLHIADLEQYPDTYYATRYSPHAQPFDYAAMLDVQAWLANAERVMLIYGANDPWTAGAMAVNSGRDSLRFVAPAANHGASMFTIKPEDRAQAVESLARWMKVSVDLSTGPARDATGQVENNLGDVWKRSIRGL